MNKFSLVSLFLFFVGCSTFTITKDDLVSQLAENQKREEVTQFIPVGGVASIFLSNQYVSNMIEKILCNDRDGKKVYLYPNKDTILEITRKSDGEVVKMYFDTVFLDGDKLIGLRSRLIQSMTREINIDDIEKIEIYVELPKTEEVQN